MAIVGRTFLVIMIAGIIIVGSSKIQEKVRENEFRQEYKIFNPDLLTWQGIATTIPWPGRDSHLES